MQKLSTSGQINLTAAITLLQASFSFYRNTRRRGAVGLGIC